MNDAKKSPAVSPASSIRKDRRTLVLNAVIVVLVLVVGYLSYALLARNMFSPPVEPERADVATGEVIQLDVLNGCGVAGAATSFTEYLRARGFDVVEIKNYKSFDVDESMVIDRVGNLKNAQRVAYALGVKKANIVQQLNQDYYVDVSVVIGKDYRSLKPSIREERH